MKSRKTEHTDEYVAADNPGREFVAILRRGKWTILLVFLLVTGIVAWRAITTPQLYEAESSLMVRIGREYVYRPEDGRNETARTPSLSEMVNSEVEILSSRDLAVQVVRELGVQRMYPEILEVEPDPQRQAEIAVLRFRQAAAIRPVLESSVIKVGFEHAVPQVAADAVNLLIDRFKDKHLEVFGEERASRLETQLQLRTAELAKADEALAEFKRQNGVYDLDEQRTLLLGRRERVQEELRTYEGQLAELALTVVVDGESDEIVVLPPNLHPEMKTELLRQKLDLEREQRTLDPTSPDRLVEDMQMRLLDLRNEESRLLRDFNADSRFVQSVRQEIANVTRSLAEAQQSAGTYDKVRREEREARSRQLAADITRLDDQIELLVRVEQQRLRQELRARKQVLELQRGDAQRLLADLDQQIRRLDENEKALRQLERALVAAEAAVETYEARADDARISDELDREKLINVRVIEMASAPVAPSGLPRNLQIALGAFVGLLAGAGLAVLGDLFRAR